MSRVRKIYTHTHTQSKTDVSPLGSTMVSLVNMTRTSCSSLARLVAYSTFFSAPKYHSGAKCLAFGVWYSVFSVLPFGVWYSVFSVLP